jgi:hypothetical protein
MLFVACTIFLLNMLTVVLKCCFHLIIRYAFCVLTIFSTYLLDRFIVGFDRLIVGLNLLKVMPVLTNAY